jgi:plasmid maintenance system antidote protein VapI
MNIPLRLAILSSTHKTQVRLAAAIGIGEGRLSRIVNGWAMPSEDEQLRIATAVSAEPATLFATDRSAA